jgi:hypothetical protein
MMALLLLLNNWIQNMPVAESASVALGAVPF